MSRKPKQPLLILDIYGEGVDAMSSSYGVLPFTPELYAELKGLMAWMTAQKKVKGFESLLDIVLAYPRPEFYTAAEVEAMIGASVPILTDGFSLAYLKKETGVESERLDYVRCRVSTDSIVWEIGPRHADSEANSPELCASLLEKLAGKLGL